MGLVPGLHTAILRTDPRGLDDDRVLHETQKVLSRARTWGLDRHEGMALPDLALLSRLQHYGVATPLLDVTVDPLVALYMAVVGRDHETTTQPGAVFALPHALDFKAAHQGTATERIGQIDPYDDRPFADVYSAAVNYSTAAPASSGVPMLLCTAPPVTDRLAIQRAHFLLGSVDRSFSPSAVGASTLGGVRFDASWVPHFMDSLGAKGRPSRASRPSHPDFVVPLMVSGGEVKQRLREWIEPRSGLTPEMVYPTPWHEPHLEAWARRNGRLTLSVGAEALQGEMSEPSPAHSTVVGGGREDAP